MNLFLKCAQNKFQTYVLKPLLRISLSPKAFKHLAHLFLVLTLTSTVLILSPSQVSAVGPSAVQSLAVSSKTATTLNLSWTPPENSGQSISDYVIQYSTDSITWTTLIEGVNTATDASITGLVRSTNYTIRIAAISDGGQGAWASLDAIPATRATAPTNLAYTGKTETSLSFTWAAPTDNGGQPIIDYTVEYSTNGSDWTTFTDGTSTSTTATITGLARGVGYFIRVRAVNTEGTGESVLSFSWIPSPWSTITSGDLYTCGIRSDGTLWCWGFDGYGRLGRGSFPAQFDTNSNWAGFTASSITGCGTRTDRTLWCFGQNTDGQLGTGTESGGQVGTNTNWADITAGIIHSCGTHTDGTLWCWGSGYRGLIGDGTTTSRSTPVQVGTNTNWADIDAGSYHTCGIGTDGTLWCWGNSALLPNQVGTNTNWTDITGGGEHTCGLRSDGSLWCWGDNSFGQLGDGTTTSRATPVQVGTNTNWTNIDAGGTHTCGLRDDGTLWCWGSGYNYRLGDGTTTTRITPTQIGTSTNWSDITASTSHTCGIRTDGTAWCWGYNQYGSVGDGTTVARSVPTQIYENSSLNFADPVGKLYPAVAPTSPSIVLASKTETSVTVTMTPGDDGGRPITDYTIQTSTDGTTWTTFVDGVSASTSITVTDLTRGTSYQFRVAQTTAEGTSPWSTALTNIIPAVTPAEPTNIAVTSKTATTLTISWTAPDDGGQPITDYTIQTSTNGTTWTTFADGVSTNTTTTITGLTRGLTYLFRVSAINTEGSGPFTLFGQPNTWRAVATGNFHTCAIRTTGTLWCWGSNSFGQLGSGTTVDIQSPTQIGDENDWVSLSADQNYVCAIKTNGTLWCWGSNANGHLGDGTTATRLSPNQVGTSTSWREVSVGDIHTCAIQSDDSMWCWGNNTVGQVGDGTTSTRLSPVQIAGSNWKSVSSGGSFTCATKNDTSLWCWGTNNSGQVGDGTTSTRFSPVQITGSNWNQVSTAGASSCATKNDLSLWCWGNNSYRQLGDNTTTTRFSPVQLSGSNWINVEVGNLEACATSSNGEIWCWGNNASGIVADGTTTPRPAPTSTAAGFQWMKLSMIDTHACGISTNASLYCWGENSSWQIGDETNQGRLSPTAVKTSVIGVIPAVAPSAPSIGFASKTSTTVTVIVTPGDNGGQQIADYTIQYSTDGTNWTTFNDGVSTSTSITVTDLTRGTPHQFRVAQTTAEGTSPYSAALTNIIPAVTPAAPTNIAVTSKTATTLTIAWTAPDDGGHPITDYTIQTSANGTTWTTFVDGVSTATTATITSLTRGAGYFIRVRAINTEGTGANGDSATNWTNISAGDAHSCGLRSDGSLWCWGDNSFGQLGDGTTTSRTTPTRIGTTTNWTNISAGGARRTCGIQSDNTLWCWGHNDYGQLGDGTTSTTPTRIGTNTNWTTISTGGNH